MDEQLNWGAFKAKYNKRESWAFEQLCYLLFCTEFNNRVGLFRYKNQTGIETEPLEKEGKYYGFQSKYYTTSIDENKDDIIDSIKKAKMCQSKKIRKAHFIQYKTQKKSKNMLYFLSLLKIMLFLFLFCFLFFLFFLRF